MRKFVLGFVLIALPSFLQAASIDFSVTTTERTLEGIKFTLLNFHDNGKRISYQQPRGWTYSGDAQRIKFTPPNLTGAQAEIEQTPLPEPAPLDETMIKELHQKALASVPPGSQKVTILEEEKNPLTISGHETYSVTVGFEAFGHEFRKSVLYLNLPDKQVRFCTTARKQDFDKVHKGFRASLYSWQWL
jgi:hypothetical protein